MIARNMIAVKAIILTGSFIGFTIQVLDVSLEYFSYKTRTEVHISIPKMTVFRNVALCIGLVDLPDVQRLRVETGIMWDKPKDWTQALGFNPPLTIKQIFDYTPDSGSVMSSCSIRRTSWLKKHFSGSQCGEIFVVEKYFTQDYMCYMFKPQKVKEMPLRYVTQAQHGAANIYSLYLSSNFSQLNFLSLMVFMGTYPYISRDFSQVAYITALYGSKNKIGNFFDLYAADIVVKKMLPPYDTMCLNASEEM